MSNPDYVQGTTTIGATATKIVSVDAGTGGIYLTNTGAADVFLGGATVTASGAKGGPKLAAGASLIFPTSAGPTDLYAICATSSTVAWAYPPV